MPLWIAALLGVIEGLTEFLPVSSTGHLVLASSLLHVEGSSVKTFEIVIQSGAILAVVVHYRALLWKRLGGLFRRDPASVRLAVALAIAFVPAAVLGLALRHLIKELLFRPIPVALALLVGGVAMIVVERWFVSRRDPEVTRLEEIDPRRALKIGLAQCLALWPGTSRSMCTIVGGQLSGLSTPVAAEFSFLLALPVLGAATALDVIKGGRDLVATPAARNALVVGLLVSFVVAWAVIGLFLRWLQRRGVASFGWYRIALGVAVLALAFAGVLSFGAS